MSFLVAYFLPLFYLLAIAAWLLRGKLGPGLGFSRQFVTVFFLAKCAAGLLYTLVALKFIPNRGDMWGFFEDGTTLYQLLWQNPTGCWQAIVEMFSISDAAITNTQSDYIRSAFEGIKFIHFLLNFLSGGNIYTNTIIFNALALWPLLRCWQFLRVQWQCTVLPFWFVMLPSAFFYSAGIHKEGLVLVLVSALLPQVHALVARRRWQALPGAIVLLGLLLFFKVFVGLTFLAALVLWALLAGTGVAAGKGTAVAVVGGLLLFFGTHMLVPALNFPQYIVSRQQEFLALEAASRIAMQPLQPQFWSFVKALPSSLAHVLFSPMPGAGGKAWYLVFSAEMLSYWALVAWWVVKARGKRQVLPPLLWALVVFGGINLLVIGYTIPNIGAIMRYRSIFMPCLLVGFCGFFAGQSVMPGLRRCLSRYVYHPPPG
ncbi:MAG: hypothetical protein EAY75_13110 [Bacteroidetes bacterium]|nr:MAG: hypothetical protein EAY75_13110 [Bacteroidota bacterium]